MRKNTQLHRIQLAVALLLATLIGSKAVAGTYNYLGTVEGSTDTCNAPSGSARSFADGVLDVEVGANDSFDAGAVSFFEFEIDGVMAETEAYAGRNAPAANPLSIDGSLAELRDSVIVAATQEEFTTGGTTDSGGELVSGTILLELLQSPYRDAGAWLVFDLETGEGQLCLLFETTGCVPGLTELAVIQGSFGLSPDSDGDGVRDDVDNCTNDPNPGQRDTDGDGHGNRCDGDFNQDCIVNPIDLSLLRLVFFSADPDADMNGDGFVNVLDLGIFRSQFFGSPGPSPVGSLCNP